MAILYAALAGKPKALLWDTQEEGAFTKAKKSLVAVTTMSFPTTNAPPFLSMDANNIAMGVVLDQVIDGTPCLWDFFSKKVNEAKNNYSTFGHELFIIYLAVWHFQQHLHFTNTDHQPLVHTFSKTQDTWSARRRHHLSAIIEYGSIIRHIPENRETCR